MFLKKGVVENDVLIDFGNVEFCLEDQKCSLGQSGISVCSLADAGACEYHRKQPQPLVLQGEGRVACHAPELDRMTSWLDLRDRHGRAYD